MAVELKIPNLGESITEVQIAQWLKADGDEVKRDENVAVIDSEKTTLELPSPENGRLKILHQAGDMVKVGEAVATIETKGATEKPKAEKAESNGNAKSAGAKMQGKKSERSKIESEPEVASDLGIKRKAAPQVKPEEKPEFEDATGRAAGEMP